MSSNLTVFAVSMVQDWEGSGRAVILEALGSTDSMNQYMEIDLCGQVSHTELLNSVNQSQNWSSICWSANAKGRPIKVTVFNVEASSLSRSSSHSFKSVEEGL